MLIISCETISKKRKTFYEKKTLEENRTGIYNFERNLIFSD